MPEISQLTESLKKQLRELERLQRESQKNAEKTAAMLSDLQSKIKQFEKKRRS